MLEVQGLQFDYGDKPLLQNISFALSAGSALHIKGANGAGKTTLLKLLAGLLYPTEGEIKHQQNLVYVGHKAGVNMHLTPREHIGFDLSSQLSDELIDVSLRRLKLFELQHTPCGLLSAGQCRRVGLLQLINSDALLWLLDEPWVALDHESMDVLTDLLLAHVNIGGAVIFTSHQPLPFDFPVLQELVV
ncbi:MAG: heme ABC exporter ATP-binding protein CcmA [Legionellaceae bacterium]|jgi:heme exporter protein A|nr:heme ABC exporter ATP-binding protein CcmA [Legionellaceae bacterium]